MTLSKNKNVDEFLADIISVSLLKSEIIELIREMLFCFKLNLETSAEIGR